jgi:hypothetical protein
LPFRLQERIRKIPLGLLINADVVKGPGDIGMGRGFYTESGAAQCKSRSRERDDRIGVPIQEDLELRSIECNPGVVVDRRINREACFLLGTMLGSDVTVYRAIVISYVLIFV